MRAAFIFSALLYGALALGASPAAADLSAAQVDALMAARAGDMKKLVIHKEPRPRLEKAFEDARGAAHTVADWKGEVVVFNFWATWCPPCRKEMPSLDRLKGAGEGVEVVALSMDRASVPKIESFFQSIQVENLEVFREPTLRIGAEAGVLGMPVTLILDREGREIARLQGEAEWDGPDARAMLKAIVSALDSQG